MVVYEAARAMVNLKNVTVREVHPARCGLVNSIMVTLYGDPVPLIQASIK